MMKDRTPLQHPVVELLAAYCFNCKLQGRNYAPSREDFQQFCVMYRQGVLDEFASTPEDTRSPGSKYLAFKDLKLPL